MNEKNANRQIISYLTLRRIIGILGIAFPFVLILGGIFTQNDPLVLESMSSYYGSAMRNIFVAFLFGIGLFLFAYKGYKPIDDWMGHLGGLFAFGVAFCPTSSENSIIHTAHFIFALLLFLVLSYFCLFLFVKTDKKTLTPRKKKRNIVYRTCGIVILVSMVILGIFHATHVEGDPDPFRIVLIFETVMLIAFGYSWITKGEMIWKDIEDAV